VYLSDSGGHANLWVARTDGSGLRQITSQRDLTVAVGIPLWSPAGNGIAFRLTRGGTSQINLIQADGSGLREIVPRGMWASWSGDGRWLYYVPARDTTYSVEKIPIDGGPPLVVRRDNAGGPAPSPDGATLYFVTPLKRGGAGWGWEVRKARPEDGPSQILARIAGSRVPVNPLLVQPTVSPDGKWIALPLIDGVTTNLWALPTDGGPMQKLTDFGDWPIIIARRVAWSADSRHIYAAVAELDADVVLLDGLLR